MHSLVSFSATPQINVISYLNKLALDLQKQLQDNEKTLVACCTSDSVEIYDINHVAPMYILRGISLAEQTFQILFFSKYEVAVLRTEKVEIYNTRTQICVAEHIFDISVHIYDRMDCMGDYLIFQSISRTDIVIWNIPNNLHTRIVIAESIQDLKVVDNTQFAVFSSSLKYWKVTNTKNKIEAAVIKEHQLPFPYFGLKFDFWKPDQVVVTYASSIAIYDLSQQKTIVQYKYSDSSWYDVIQVSKIDGNRVAICHFMNTSDTEDEDYIFTLYCTIYDFRTGGSVPKYSDIIYDTFENRMYKPLVIKGNNMICWSNNKLLVYDMTTLKEKKIGSTCTDFAVQ